MTKNLSKRLATTWRNCASLATSASDGFSARIFRRIAGSRSRRRCSSIGRLSSCLVARPHRERIERGADAHHHADRPARHLRGQRQAFGARLVHRLDQPPPALRVLVAVGEQEPDRPAGLLGELASSSAARTPRRRSRCSCRTRRCRSTPSAEPMPSSSSVVGVARRHQLAVRRLVRIGARGGEAERAGAQRLDRQPAHLGDVVRRRRLRAGSRGRP